MFVHRAWYWAAWPDEVNTKPLYRKLIDQHVVLYRDSAGAVVALGAQCPHRGANLGEGRVEGDCIRCPFHGFRFDPTGACVEIPSQAPDTRIPGNARVPVYPVREQDGIVWFWADPDAAPDHEPARYPCLDPEVTRYVAQRQVRRNDSDFVITAETMIENSHLPYIHAKSFGFTSPRIPRYVVQEFEDGRGFRATYDPDSPVWFDTGLEDDPRIQKFTAGRRKITETMEWRMGCQVQFHIAHVSGSEQFVVGLLTPSEVGANWFATALVTTRAGWKNRLGRVAFRLKGLNMVNDEDDRATGPWILTDRPGGLEQPVFTQSDVICSTMRRIYRRHLEVEGRRWAVADNAPLEAIGH